MSVYCLSIFHSTGVPQMESICIHYFLIYGLLFTFTIQIVMTVHCLSILCSTGVLQMERGSRRIFINVL